MISIVLLVSKNGEAEYLIKHPASTALASVTSVVQLFMLAYATCKQLLHPSGVTVLAHCAIAYAVLVLVPTTGAVTAANKSLILGTAIERLDNNPSTTVAKTPCRDDVRLPHKPTLPGDVVEV